MPSLLLLLATTRHSRRTIILFFSGWLLAVGEGDEGDNTSSKWVLPEKIKHKTALLTPFINSTHGATLLASLQQNTIRDIIVMKSTRSKEE